MREWHNIAEESSDLHSIDRSLSRIFPRSDIGHALCPPSTVLKVENTLVSVAPFVLVISASGRSLTPRRDMRNWAVNMALILKRR